MHTTPPPVINSKASNDRLLVVLCHLSSFLGVALILPLIVYLVKKDESETVAWHAKEALNFHLSVFIYGIICFFLVVFVIGAFLLIGLVVMTVVLSIVAAIRSADGERYQYPMTIRFLN